VIDPDGIRAKALRRYAEVLRGALDEALGAGASATGGASAVDPLFPMVVPADRGRSTEAVADRRGVEALHAASKEVTGRGYKLTYRQVNTRVLGRQSIIDRIAFEGREDYLDFLGKRRELERFVSEARVVLERLPQLATWVRDRPLRFVEHLGEWPELVLVCEYFARHPRPGLYVRELAIPVHTKFIEDHRRIVGDLLDILLPASSIDPEAATFEQRYGLKAPEPTIRVRFLDPALAPGPLDDLAAPVSRLALLDVSCRTAFVVENLMPFLSFPAVEGAVCIWGSGFQAAVLGSLPWLRSCRVLYWGDLDRTGLKILAAVRAALGRVEPLLMDVATWERYKAMAVEDTAAAGRDEALEGLAERELALAAALSRDAKASRLEQERIPQADLVSRLLEMGFRLGSGRGEAPG
jgi:hypothetical protein